MAWEQFTFQTGPLAEGVRKHMDVVGGHAESLKVRKAHRERVKAHARRLIRKKQTNVIEVLVENYGESGIESPELTLRTIKGIVGEVRKEPKAEKPGRG